MVTAIGTAIIFTTFPDTVNKPLEEVAHIFGDSDVVAAYHSHGYAAGVSEPEDGLEKAEMSQEVEFVVDKESANKKV